MKNKNDHVDCLCQLFRFIQTQFNKNVKVIRTDNAKDLCEGQMAKIYQKFGIEHYKSCRDTPQQNGVVERKHKHLLETTRALSFQSNLPKSFWGDCILSAAYIINRLRVAFTMRLFKTDPTRKSEPKPKVNRLENVFLF